MFNHPYIKNLSAKFQVKSPSLSRIRRWGLPEIPPGRSQDLQDPRPARVNLVMWAEKHLGSYLLIILHFKAFMRWLFYSEFQLWSVIVFLEILIWIWDKFIEKIVCALSFFIYPLRNVCLDLRICGDLKLNLVFILEFFPWSKLVY